MSVIPCEVPLVILNPFAFVLYGNRDKMVVLLLLKIVVVARLALLLCICKVQSLRLLILAILMDIVMIFLQTDGQDSTSGRDWFLIRAFQFVIPYLRII